jgi:hypothetical protein
MEWTDCPRCGKDSINGNLCSDCQADDQKGRGDDDD